MYKLGCGILTLCLLILLSCSVPQPNDNVVYAKRISMMQSDLQKQQMTIDKLRAVNDVLMQKVAKNSLASPNKINVPAGMSTPDDRLLAEMANEYYGLVLQSYRNKDVAALDAAISEMLSKTPQSPHIDNALFLRGLVSLSNDQFAEALKYFDKVVSDYPHGNKVVSAILGKGIAYKRMKLNDLAYNMFQEIKEKYPGSPESTRVAMELKVMEQQTTR